MTNDLVPQDSRRQQDVQPVSPFSQDQYNMYPMPDTPVSYGGGVAEALISDDDVPDEFRKPFWFIFNKDNVLTFLDEQRKKDKLLNMDIIRIDMLNTLPYYSYDFNLELKLDIVRNIYETKLDRAVGLKTGGIKNERIMMQSQMSEMRQITESDAGSGHDGFFKRLLGRR